MSAYDRVRSVLIRRAHPDGLVELRVADLARAARCSPRAVQYALRALVAEEDLLPVRGARQHYPAAYRLTGRLLPQPVDNPVDDRAPGVQPGVQPGAQPRGAIRGVGGKPATGPRTAPRRRGRDRQRRLGARADRSNPRETRRCPAHPDQARRTPTGECAGCRADRIAYDPTLTRAAAG